jgi:hypothetical protein
LDAGRRSHSAGRGVCDMRRFGATSIGIRIPIPVPTRKLARLCRAVRTGLACGRGIVVGQCLSLYKSL